MSETFRPESDAQAAEAVAWAVNENAPLEITGRGSKRGLGRPVQTSRALDTAALTGITLYEPEELVMTARAGTPMAEIKALLTEKDQYLAFEPADLGPLLGGDPDGDSIGGVLAANISGPRRIKAGAARDYFLGLTAISGRGEIFKTGGRVVKNVTGYDICKLMAGSYGTLAVMTEVTIKVLPAPEKTRTVLLLDLDDATAITAMARALNSAHEVSGAAHLPADLAARSAVSYVAQAGGAVTALRVEGPGPSVEYRCRALRDALKDLGPTEELHSRNAALFWRELTDIRPLARNTADAVWRISVPPRDGAALTAKATDGIAGCDYYYDWGGGLVWLAVPPDKGASHAAIRAAVAEVGGHATLIRAEEAVRAAVPVFEPQDPAKAALSRRIKEGFDPRRILNPGRMYAGV